MLKIYINNVLIPEDAYRALSNKFELYKNNFYLGAVAANTFQLELSKEFDLPLEIGTVKIIDDNNEHILQVDDITETKDYITLELTDTMMNLNFYYDASVLIDNNREEPEEEGEVGASTTTIQDILDDICSIVQIPCSYQLTTTNHIVDWWDSRITARDYISMIAEKESCFARIESGELKFIPVNSPSKKTFSIDEIDELHYGDKKVITRVVYDNGVGTFWEFGDDTGNTLYLYANNVFILDEDDVEDIYNKVDGFEFYNVNVQNAPIDSSILAGDIITFTDNDNNEYPTIAQYDLYFSGVWLGGYSFNIQSSKQEETSLLGIIDSYKSLKTEVDRYENRINTVIEETQTIDVKATDAYNLASEQGVVTGNLDKDMKTLESKQEAIEESVGNISNEVGLLDEAVNGDEGLASQISYVVDTQVEIQEDIDGLQVSRSFSGGYNLIENCVKQFGDAGWEGNFVNFNNDDVKKHSLTKSALQFMNGTETRTFQVENRVHNISFKFKKLIGLANTKVIINGETFDLNVNNEWVIFEKNIEVTNNIITVTYQSDTNASLLLVDQLLLPGNIRQVWTPNPNEIHTGVISLGGETLKIDSNSANTRFEATTDGIRVFKRDTNEKRAEFTDKGVWTDHLEGNSANIASLKIGLVGGQVWLYR